MKKAKRSKHTEMETETESSTVTEHLKDELLVILSKYPIIQAACQRAGVPKSTFYKWRKMDADFRKASNNAVVEGRRTINDVAESKLIKMINDEHITAIIFWLKHNHEQYNPRMTVEVEPPEYDKQQIAELTRAWLNSGFAQIVARNEKMVAAYKAMRRDPNQPPLSPYVVEEMEHFIHHPEPEVKPKVTSKKPLNIKEFLEKRKRDKDS